LAVVALALAGCGAASTTIPAPQRLALVYRHGHAVVLASVAGADPRLLGDDAQALLSPDGTRVLARSSSGNDEALTLYGTARRAVPRAIGALATPDYSPASVRLLCWSADSRYVALTADELSATGERGALLVLDVHSGRLVTVATGNFLGASFSPTVPDRLVYSDATVAQLANNESLLYETGADGRHTRALTRAGLASAPAWSARGIVFARLVRLGSASSSPLYALWQVAATGGKPRRIDSFTAGPPDPAAGGAALSFSTSGKRAVGDFYSTSGPVEAWAFSLGRDAQTRQISVPGATITAAAISRNGKTILVTARTSGGQPQLETLSWSGAEHHIVAGAAKDASWNS
jgi:hypothetical protein